MRWRRLGRSGVPLACQAGTAIVLASSRDRLERGVAVARRRRTRSGTAAIWRRRGLPFRLDRGRSSPGAEPRPSGAARSRSVERSRRLQAIGCRRRRGGGFAEGRVTGPGCLDEPRRLEGRRPGRLRSAASKWPGWRRCRPTESWRWSRWSSIPTPPRGTVPSPRPIGSSASIRPAPAGTLRTRLNLLVMGAGLKLEADLRPHLRGVSACSFGEPDTAGPTDRRTDRAPPRRGGGRSAPGRAGRAAARGALRAATPTSRAVTLRPRDRDVWIGWGDGARATSREDRPAAGRSLGALCGGWAAEGRPAARPRRGLLAGSDLAARRDDGGGRPRPRRRSARHLVGMERARPRARPPAMGRARREGAGVPGGVARRARALRAGARMPGSGFPIRGFEIRKLNIEWIVEYG